MRRYLMSLIAVFCFSMLTGCGTDTDSGAGEGEDTGRTAGSEDIPGTVSAGDSEIGEDSGLPEDAGSVPGGRGTLPDESDTIKLRIVDGADSGQLILAGEGMGQVYTLSVDGNPDISIFLDGQPADAGALEDGMMAEISYDGAIEESYPGQFGQVYSISVYSLGTQQNPAGSYYDLCGLYLQVLEDLWDRDRGLNSDVSFVSVDLSEAPGGLSEGERHAIAWIFGCGHQVEVMSLTYEELAEQGYLTEAMPGSKNKLYQWEEGALFRIVSPEGEGGAHSFPEIRFSASKWRSPRGAYILNDCTALWPETGPWESYEIGEEAIS